MSPQAGLILRMVGPLIELGCAAALLRYRGRGLAVAGLPVEWLCYGGFAFGLLLVIAGLTLVRRPAPVKGRPPDE